MKDTLESRIHNDTFLIYDGWTSTDAAAESLGYKHAPAVIHEAVTSSSPSQHKHI